MSYRDTKKAKTLAVGDRVSYQGANGQVALTVAQILPETGWVNIRLQRDGRDVMYERWRPNRPIPMADAVTTPHANET